MTNLTDELIEIGKIEIGIQQIEIGKLGKKLGLQKTPSD